MVKKLKEKGAKDQLLMFLAGPSGSGKSTGVTLVRTFCFKFCCFASIIFDDKTFYFTAITGSAASLFGGVTLALAAHQYQQCDVFRVGEGESFIHRR